VTWEELRRLGLSDGAIERRVRRGTLWPKHPGVYAVGRPDLSQTEPFAVLQRTLNEADYRRLVTADSLDAFLADVRGHRGIGALRRAMLDQAPTRSHLEDRFYKLIREAGMPRPLVNHKVEGYECQPQLRPDEVARDAAAEAARPAQGGAASARRVARGAGPAA
jgi:hypothetical protein